MKFQDHSVMRWEKSDEVNGDVFPIENGGIPPFSYVGLPEGTHFFGLGGSLKTSA